MRFLITNCSVDNNANVTCGKTNMSGSPLPQECKQTALFIYKYKPRFHRCYDHNQLHTEFKPPFIVFSSCLGLYKNYSHILCVTLIKEIKSCYLFIETFNISAYHRI